MSTFADYLVKPITKIVEMLNVHGRKDQADGCVVRVMRRHKRYPDRLYEQAKVRVGPNLVHHAVFRRDGTYEDLGISKNLLTNIGRDAWAQAWGFEPAGTTLASYVSTAITGTTIQDTGSLMTASNLATPQLGLAGLRVYAAPHTTTNPVVWGNIVSNTTHIITVDQWWKYAAGANGPPVLGTTPTSGDAYVVAPAGLAGISFIALSTNASAASAADTVLASEVTTNGGGRVLAAYAHTYGTGSLTLSNTFTASGTITAIHKGGLFGCLTSAGADPMWYETVFNADATLANLDTDAVTWTVNLSG